MDKIIDQEHGREQRRRAVANLDVDALLTLVDAANEYIVAGLCGDPSPDAWKRLLVELRNAGLADS